MGEAILIVSTDDWSQKGFTDRDGKHYRVEGECDTPRCNAVCCRVANMWGETGKGPCHNLMDDNRCEPHAKRGPGCKPVSCWFWPKRQIDIDTVNAQAERFGMPQRCHLKVVEWPQ